MTRIAPDPSPQAEPPLPAPPATSTAKLGSRVGALDGLRGVCVLFVFATHCSTTVFPGGFVALDIFFVMSAYLITTLLTREYDQRGTIDFRSFFVRRARRLVPALYVAIAVVSVVALPVGYFVGRDTIAAATYTMDAYAPLFRTYGGLWAQTWSLGVEEQFYLLWPFLLLFALRRRVSPGAVIIAVAVLSSVLAVVTLRWFTTTDIYRSPLPHVVELAAGVLLALHLRRHPVPRVLRSTTVAIGAFLVFLVGQFTFVYTWMFWYVGGIALMSVVGVVIVGHVVGSPTSPLVRGFDVAPLRWLGLRSYAFYLWHYPVLALLEIEMHDVVLRTLLGLAVTLVCMTASWRFVEEPMLRKVRRRVSEVRPVETLAETVPPRVAGGPHP